jgi:hypothetical protein
MSETENPLHVILDEVFERLVLAENRLDDGERHQQAQDKRVPAPSQRTARSDDW